MGACNHEWAYGDRGRQCLKCDVSLFPAVPIPADDAGFRDAVQAIYEEARDVLLKKHHDYGPKNIALSPGGALNGLRVRLWDKMARLNHLIDTGADAKNEPLRDSFLDMANYAIIAMLVLDGEWPND